MVTSYNLFSVNGCTSLHDVGAAANIHVIGVAGVAMAQLAVALQKLGHKVSGSDKEFYEPMGGLLRRSNITLFQGYNPTHIPQDCNLVVVGNAVSRDNLEVIETQRRGLNYTIFPKLLSEIMIDGRHSIVVSGTHGKTTTTAITAHILRCSSKSPGYFVGGVAHDLPSSLEIGDGKVAVVEGDEYDSAFFAKVPKFTFYRPQTLIINAIEFDHADIYANLAQIEEEFTKLVSSVPEAGLILCCVDFEAIARLVPIWRSRTAARIVTFGERHDSNWQLKTIATDSEGRQFCQISGPDDDITITLNISGVYNLKNALAALLACEEVGVSRQEALMALKTFVGVKRRQEIRAENKGITLVEDFAHHPTAVRETLSGLAAKFPERRMIVAFEPRSATSRKRVFQDAYSSAFSLAKIVLLNNVQLRQTDKTEDLLDVEVLANSIDRKGVSAKHYASADEIFAELKVIVKSGDVLVVMSNGAFGGLIEKLERWVNE